MSATKPEPAGLSSTLQSLLGTLMNSVDEAVHIDNLTQLDTLLQQTAAHGAQDFEQWLLDNESAATLYRDTIVTLAVNEATVELFHGESRQQVVDHLNATKLAVASPDFIGMVCALRGGATSCTGTFFRHDLRGQLISAVVETQFVRAGGRVLACHIIRQTRVVKQLEDQLSKIRQLHSLAVSATDTGCWELSFVDQSLSADSTCHRLLGYEEDVLPVDPDGILPMIHPDDRVATQQMARRLNAGDSDEFRSECRLRDRSGTWRWFLAHGRAMESLPDGRFGRMVGTLRQIDVDKKTEELLKIEKQGFAMQAANHSLRDTLDLMCLRLEEVWLDTRCCITPFHEATRAFREGSAPSMPAEFTNQLQDLSIDSAAMACSEAVRTRQAIVIDDLLADGRYAALHDEYRAWGIRRCWSTPAITPDGRLVATLCVFSDSPGSAAREDLQLLQKFAQTLAILILQYEQDDQQKQLELRLQVQDKFQSLGKLAGGIAHDFNNLLTVIAGHGELLQLQLSDHPAAVETSEKILHATRVATSLCRQMLTFAGKATAQIEPVDMNDIAREVCGLLKPGLREDIQLITQLNSAPAILQGDRGMLSQIIMNLVSNAADATSEHGGRICVAVSTDGIRVPRRELVVQDNVSQAADWICLTVTDDGSGIDEDIQEQIFDPFFTTRDAGKGLGLATVMGIIRRHRGAVQVASRPGETTFRVFLPRNLETSPQSAFDWPVDPDNTERRRILLTDDDRAVRLSLTSMLQAAGYELKSFASGEKLLTFMSRITPEDVILLDQNMPGLKGSDTYERLRENGLQNPVCFVTAYEAEPIQEILDRDDACCLVQKPVQISTICNAIRRLSARVCVQ